MDFRLICIGDSRTFGAGDPGDRLPLYGANTTFGSAYTVLPQVALVGGSGTGGAVGVGINPNTGKLYCYKTADGSGYTSGSMPTVQVTGGDGTPPDFTQGAGPSGGWVPGLESKLRAGGFPSIVCLNYGSDGDKISPNAPTGQNADRMLAALAGGEVPANTVVVFDWGINDALQGVAASAVHDAQKAMITFLVAAGAYVILDYPYGTPNQAGAENSLLATYTPQFDSILSDFNTSNPGKVFKGFEAGTGFSNVSGNFADGLHPNTTGDSLLAQGKSDAYTAILNHIASVAGTATNDNPSYESAASNEVSIVAGYIPNAPIIMSFSGLGTFLNPQTRITWGAGTWGAVDVFRLTLGAPGAAGTYQKIASEVGSVVDDPTSVPTSHIDNTVVNGVTYKYQLRARPDYNP